MARNRRGSSDGGAGSRRGEGGGGGGSRRNGPGKSRRRSNKVPARKFWGDPDAPRVTIVSEGPSDEPAAVVLSLGPPPFPGLEAMSGPAFETVYTRAVAMAAALEVASTPRGDSES